MGGKDERNLNGGYGEHGNGEFVVGAMYVLVGYALFRWFEFQAKRRGTLETV